MSTWDELKIGDTAQVVTLGNADPEYRSQLLAWGFLPGAKFTVLGFSPCNDLIAVLIRGASLAVRRSEVKLVTIEKFSLP